MFVNHLGSSNGRLGQLIAADYACLFVHFYHYNLTGLIFSSCSSVSFFHVSDVGVSQTLLFALLDACKPYQSNTNTNIPLTFLPKMTRYDCEVIDRAVVNFSPAASLTFPWEETLGLEAQGESGTP